MPSENRYADVDGDGSPDVAIGRLPVQTPEEADVMVDKISRQAEVLREAGVRHLFVVDNEAARDPSFSSEAARVAALLGAGADVSWADLAQGVDQARTDLLDGLAAGPVATHYFGHGSEDFWADENLIDAGRGGGPASGRTRDAAVRLDLRQPELPLRLGPVVPRGDAARAASGARWPRWARRASPNARLQSRPLRAALSAPPARRARSARPCGGPRRRPCASIRTRVPVVEGWSLLGDPALTLPVAAPAQ